jgi:thiamine biosynthesis lipoprotein
MLSALRGVGPLIVLALLEVRTVPLPVPVRPDVQPPLPHEFAQVHMGMPVRIRLYCPTDESAKTAASAAFARVAVLDQMMSDYRPDSELSRLGTVRDTWSIVSPDLFEVLEVARATGGAFDPTVGPLVAIWRDARKSQRMPDESALASARRRVGWRHIRLDVSRRAVRLAMPGMRLDLGGIAKGYILQQALGSMASLGVTQALVEAGGDIVVGDAPPGRDGWRIDADGADAPFAARAARLTNAALATSGPAAQFVEIGGLRYSHVVDPRTGLGLTNAVTARVIARDGAIADALATALTVAGPAAVSRIQSRFPGVVTSVGRQ